MIPPENNVPDVSQTDAPPQPPPLAFPSDDNGEDLQGDFVANWLADRGAGADHDPELIEIVAKHRKGDGLAEGPLLKALLLYGEKLAESLRPPTVSEADKVAGGGQS